MTAVLAPVEVRVRAFAVRAPARLILLCQVAVFGGWLAVAGSTGALLGGGGASGLGRTAQWSVLVGVTIFMAIPIVGMLYLPVFLVLLAVNRLWKSMPGSLYEWPRVILGVVVAPLVLAVVFAHEVVPLAVHPAVYGMMVVGWTVFAIAGLGAATEMARWLRPPRRPAHRLDLPEPEEVYWSPTAMAGWRGWTWTGSTLRGMWQEWPTSHLVADCSHGCLRPPDWICTCGIYAVTDRARATHGDIVGLVELTGKVIEHEDGYRAEHARIVTLYAPAHIAAQIEAAYPDVEVIPQ